MDLLAAGARTDVVPPSTMHPTTREPLTPRPCTLYPTTYALYPVPYILYSVTLYPGMDLLAAGARIDVVTMPLQGFSPLH
jgi:hypothetical protein